MEAVIFGVPKAPPPVPDIPRERATMTWTGWDGSRWDISDPWSGTFLTQAGTEGMGAPTHTAWAAPSSPFVHGQEFTGLVYDPRPVFWPLYLYHDGTSAEWRERDRALWHSLRAGRHGTWTVSYPDSTRTLRCRYDAGGEDAMARDGSFFGWSVYGIKLIADDPFWYSEPIERTFPPTVARPFLNRDAATTRAPFYITSSTTQDTATLDNPGDVDAWPVWTVQGPATSVQLGTAGRLVSYTKPIPEGQTLVIDSSPHKQTALLNGVDVTADLGSYDFAPIPPGEERPITIQVVGAATVSARIVPRHERAW